MATRKTPVTKKPVGDAATPKRPAAKKPAAPRPAAKKAAPAETLPVPVPVATTDLAASAELRPAPGPQASPLARWVYEQRVAAARYAVARPVEVLRGDESLGDLPAGYGTHVLTLLPLNPSRAYAYWDLDYRRLGEGWQGLADGRPVVRLFRAVNGRFELAAEIEIDLGSHNHYFPVQAGATYAAELGIRGGGGYHRVLGSNVLTVPTDRVSDAAEASFVSMPLHAPLPVGGFGPAAPGLAGAGGRALSRDEYERLWGRGVAAVPGSAHR